MCPEAGKPHARVYLIVNRCCCAGTYYTRSYTPSIPQAREQEHREQEGEEEQEERKMLPQISRRSALSARSIPVPLGPRLFHSTTPAFQQDANRSLSNRMPPRRVKTPWIEALTKSREEARATAGGLKSANVAGQAEGAAKKRTEADLKPKKMADSFHSVVCAPGVAWSSLVWGVGVSGADVV